MNFGTKLALGTIGGFIALAMYGGHEAKQMANAQLDAELAEIAAAVMEAPAPAPAPVVKAPAPVVKEYKYTYEYAEKEICDAAHQYRDDMIHYGVTKAQAKGELSLYAKYLGQNSPANGASLLRIGNACLGL